MVGTLSGGFSSSMGALTGADNFAPQRAGFSQMIQQTASGGNTALVEALSRMRKGCDSITTDSNKALKQAATDLEKNLRESQQGLECQITQAADQAASEEPPAWKMLVAILLVILVIVIIIAVTILTAGMALGPLALIGLGALVGGLTAGLIALASNLWNNRPTMAGSLQGRAHRSHHWRHRRRSRSRGRSTFQGFFARGPVRRRDGHFRPARRRRAVRPGRPVV